MLKVPSPILSDRWKFDEKGRDEKTLAILPCTGDLLLLSEVAFLAAGEMRAEGELVKEGDLRVEGECKWLLAPLC